MNWIREHKLASVLISVLVMLLVIFVVSVYTDIGNSGPANVIRRGVISVTNKLSGVSDSIGDNVGGIFSYKKLLEENEKLKEENSKLKMQLTENEVTKEELAQLDALSEVLNYKKVLGEFSTVTANITSKDESNWVYSFVINRGSESGIKVGNTVVNDKGLVGIVDSVGDGWAKISSIVENTNKISFRVVGNEEEIGIVTGGKDGSLSGYLLNEKTNVKVGDKIITSGDGRYPKGISIGTVDKVEFNEINLLNEVMVKSDVNFRILDKVVVIL